MSGKRDVPGNARESTLRAQEFLMRTGEELLEVERLLDRAFEAGVEVVSLRVKFPVGEGDGYLAVLKANVDGTASVGFHDGTSYTEVTLGMFRRLKQGTVKWREDKWDG